MDASFVYRRADAFRRRADGTIQPESVASVSEKSQSKVSEKNIWLYSGYLFERDILGTSRIHSPTTDELIALIDVLVDGEFVLEKKDIALKFRGSSNQRIIDVKESLKRGETVLVESLMKDSL